MPPGQVIVFFVGLIAIIFAAYYVTYYIGLKASGQSRGRLRNKNINIVDRFSISKDKSFCLVEIGGKVYVIGITNQSMTLIDTLDAAAFSEAAAEQRDKPLWQAAPGGRFTGPMTRKLAGFMAKKMGRTLDGSVDAEYAPPPDGGSFSDSMEAAREKDRSGRTGRYQAENAGNAENTGKTGNAGNAENTGKTENAGNAENTGKTENAEVEE